MMLRHLSVILLLVAQLWTELPHNVAALIAANPLRGYHGAPIIDPFDSVVIGVGESRTVECKARHPITWVSSLIEKNPETVKITHFLHEAKSDDSILFTDEQNHYRSNLELSDAATNLVGHYYCVFNETVDIGTSLDLKAEVISYKASSIYVFVNDPENLLFQPDEPIVVGRQFEPFEIPCKPNSPHVRVELIKEDGEVKETQSYDDRVGFKLVENTTSEGFYDCSASLDGKLEIVQINFIVYPPLSAYIKKPLFSLDTDIYAKEGAPIHLTCEGEVESDAPYNIYFILPNGLTVNETSDFVALSPLEHEPGNRNKAHRNLTIANALKSRDGGDYTCKIEDFHENTNSAIHTISFVDEPVVEFRASNQNITLMKAGKKQVNFLVNYVIYPKPTFEILNNKDEVIARDDDLLNRKKYDVNIGRDQIKLTIKFPTLEDYGEYTIVAHSDGNRYEQKLFLVVPEKPTCMMRDVYVQHGDEVHMLCECLAYPIATITWSFQPCLNVSAWPDCGRNTERASQEQDSETDSTPKSPFSQVSDIRFTPTQPGFVTCKARNELGPDRVTAQVKVGDLPPPGFTILGLSDDHRVAAGDQVKLECGAIIYNYTNSVRWTKNGAVLDSTSGVEVEGTHTDFSWRQTLVFNEITQEQDGEYVCEVEETANGETSTLSAFIQVNEAKAPTIETNFNESVISRTFSESLSLECFTSGLPEPTLKWTKDGEDLELAENDTRVALMNNGMKLVFTVLKVEDKGTYACVAQNRLRVETRSVEVDVTAPSTPVNMAIIVGVVAIILVLVLLSLYLCLKVRMKKRQIAALKAAGLANFEEGQVESIDPDVNIDEQADLLPYDKKFEFPREKLKLGKQLGAGAFGVVVKAVAQGIVHYEDESTVAVKMVKKQTDNEVMKALVSELKIMIHMGQHLNVVNLLGAVTKNIAKRELMVIVEYCRFGNLQSFLVKHRPYFIDQVRNDRIDPMIMKNEMRWSKNSAYNSYNSQGLKYISVAFANDKVMPKEHSYINNINGNRYINFSDGNQYTPPQNLGLSNPGAHMNTQGYVRHSGFHQVDSCNTEATVVSNMETVSGEDNALLSTNSDQPMWRSNYTADYKGPTRMVCTSDLVCWAFQVARGMDYLATRKVLHGDLAARNILLCDDNIVKICDFGLARSMYKNDNYKKKGEAPLPFKWLSIEAISDHVFSTYSDVWAFGVVLWELFTLGKVPYTGMEANQELFYKLRDGYRMEKPKYATQDLYDIMLNCWNAKPESRPLFNQLERRLSSFMMDSVKDHYLDLNEPYLQANTKHYESGIRDYLTQLSVPDGEAPKPPMAQEELFRVDNSTTDVPSTPDYLSMSPKSGVVKYKADYLRPDSPTIAKNLDTSPKNKKNVNKRPELPEEIPMLAHNQNGLPAHESDEEPSNAPAHTYTDMRVRRNSSGRKKRQAPQPPAVPSAATDTSEPEYKNVFVGNENYVNVSPVNKNASVANPAYITFQSVNERA